MRQLLAAGLLAIGLLPAPPMFTTASDNFTGADNTTLGTNWIDPESEWGIKSNAATQRNISVNNQAVAWWNPSVNSFSGNQFSQVTCGTISGATPPYGAQQCGLGVNMSGGSIALVTGYTVFYNSVTDAWSIQRQDAGPTYTSLTSGTRTPIDGDVLYLENSSGTLTLKVNGTTLGTASDSTYGSGQPGLNIYSTLGSVDQTAYNSWSGGDLGAGTTFPAAIINAPIRCCRSPR
jgi:hypothetical protein